MADDRQAPSANTLKELKWLCQGEDSNNATQLQTGCLWATVRFFQPAVPSPDPSEFSAIMYLCDSVVVNRRERAPLVYIGSDWITISGRENDVICFVFSC